jgi:SPP1 gp7 family putative phage head morphogenesis protein
MRLLNTAMNEVRREVIRDEGKLLDGVEHLSLDKVVNMVTDEPWLEMQQALQDELLGELNDAGKRVKLPAIQKATIVYSFDATRPEAAAWAQLEAGKMVSQVIESQRDVVRDYASRASMGEFTPRQVARGLRDVVGLTTQQSGWVQNFRDNEIGRQMATGKNFDQAYAASEKATDRYHNKIHRYRTETIARTETLRASNEGRNLAWQQGLDEGFINPNASKVWSAELDGRVCDLCAPLDGVIVPIKGSFSAGDPPRHPNCRCTVLLTDAIPTDIASMTDAQLDAEIESLLSPEIPLPNQMLSPVEQVAQLKAESDSVYSRMASHLQGKEVLSDADFEILSQRRIKIYDEIYKVEQKTLVVQVPKMPVPKPSAASRSLFDDLVNDVSYEGGDDVSRALQEWQGEGYRRIGGALQKGINLDDVSSDIVSTIETLEDGMNMLPRNTKLFRGQTEGLDILQVDDLISNQNFTAATTDLSTAGMFSKSAGGVLGKAKPGDLVTLMEINTKQTFGLAIKGSDEFEVLLERGLNLRVTGSRLQELDGVKYRIMEVSVQ